MAARNLDAGVEFQDGLTRSGESVPSNACRSPISTNISDNFNVAATCDTSWPGSVMRIVVGEPPSGTCNINQIANRPLPFEGCARTISIRGEATISSSILNLCRLRVSGGVRLTESGTAWVSLACLLPVCGCASLSGSSTLQSGRNFLKDIVRERPYERLHVLSSPQRFQPNHRRFDRQRLVALNPRQTTLEGHAHSYTASSARRRPSISTISTVLRWASITDTAAAASSGVISPSAGVRRTAVVELVEGRACSKAGESRSLAFAIRPPLRLRRPPS